MALESRRRDFWLKLKLRIKNWWFKITVQKGVRKRLIKLLYETKYYEGNGVNHFFVVPTDFKYSDDEVAKALNNLVRKGELKEIIKTKRENEDGYLVVVATRNRSQRRISRAFPNEIDLNKVNVESITQNETPTPQTSADKAEEQQTQITKTIETLSQPNSDIDDSKPF